MFSTRRGFTLIELMVVITIIVLLAAIAITYLATARQSGTDAGIKRALTEARTQGEIFYQANSDKYVITRGTATDVCSVNGLAGTTSGAYAQVLRAAEIAGVTLSTSYNVAGNSTTAVCHTCTSPASGCSSAYANSWAASVPLKSDPARYYCIDSHGFSGVSSNNLAAGDTYCAQ